MKNPVNARVAETLAPLIANRNESSKDWFLGYDPAAKGSLWAELRMFGEPTGIRLAVVFPHFDRDGTLDLMGTPVIKSKNSLATLFEHAEASAALANFLTAHETAIWNAVEGAAQERQEG